MKPLIVLMLLTTVFAQGEPLEIEKTYGKFSLKSVHFIDEGPSGNLKNQIGYFLDSRNEIEISKNTFREGESVFLKPSYKSLTLDGEGSVDTTPYKFKGYIDSHFLGVTPGPRRFSEIVVVIVDGGKYAETVLEFLDYDHFLVKGNGMFFEYARMMEDN